MAHYQQYESVYENVFEHKCLCILLRCWDTLSVEVGIYVQGDKATKKQRLFVGITCTLLIELARCICW